MNCVSFLVDHDLTCEEEDWDEPTDDDPYRKYSVCVSLHSFSYAVLD